MLCADYRITSNTAKSEIEMDCNPIDSDNEITIDMIRPYSLFILIYPRKQSILIGDKEIDDSYGLLVVFSDR